jgi:hypothetical protein
MVVLLYVYEEAKTKIPTSLRYIMEGINVSFSPKFNRGKQRPHVPLGV